MVRSGWAAFLSYGVVCFVVPSLYAQAKLSPEELAVRKEMAGRDAVRLLELVPLADAAAAVELRRRVAKVLAEVPEAERATWAGKIVPLLAAAAPTPDDLRVLLGPPPRISRQMVYRRAIEQWTYETPLPLCITWQAAAGQEMQMQAVQPLAAKNR
jgi:hypothetical protein